MCGRYVLASRIEVIEKRFGVSARGIKNWLPSPNVSPGEFAPVITMEKPSELQLYKFGFTPSWAKKQTYVINARAEGDLNKQNDPLYSGQKGIIKKPFFRSVIRKQRCLIITDAFIEGPQKEKLSEPYVVYLKEKQRPFAFAGLYDAWINPETGESIPNFSIVTTVANTLIQKIRHHRCPVILDRESESLWLNQDTELAEATDLLKPYPADLMNAYPISNAIKNPRMKDMAVLEPIGERLALEEEYTIKDDLILEGMGETRARKRKRKEGKD